MKEKIELTESERRLLLAIAKSPMESAPLETIAGRLGFRPARSGILAVASMCRAMVRKYPYCGRYPENQSPDTGRFLLRLPPRDQWGCAYWNLTDEARDLVKRLQREEKRAAAKGSAS